MLKDFAEFTVYYLFGMSRGTRLSDALEFFIYDTIKIFFLLSVIIFIVAVVRSYFPPEKTKRILSHKREFIGNIFAMHGTLSTPGLIVNGKIKHTGKPLPALEKMKELIRGES